MTAEAFNRLIWRYYREHKRNFPWRETTDPYKILVSEVMLQQTQTGRVVPYYEKFLTHFPTVKRLARTSTAELLAVWQGLGYNRRALSLKKSAQIIEEKYQSNIPHALEELISLPGIGHHTAGAILAYAFNRSEIFIETNIRKTIIHSFFPDREKVSDKEIDEVLQTVIDKKNPREWYWAIVDYGSMLGSKKIIRNNRSGHYRKQTPFEGSNRQIRSGILKSLLQQTPQEIEAFVEALKIDEDLVLKNLIDLEKEGFIEKRKEGYSIKK
jgi:A/G-specific adenine glycosylase